MDSWDGANYGVPYSYATGGPWTNNYFTLSGTRCGIFKWFIDNEGSSEFFGPNNLSSLTLFSTRTTDDRIKICNIRIVGKYTGRRTSVVGITVDTWARVSNSITGFMII